MIDLSRFSWKQKRKTQRSDTVVDVSILLKEVGICTAHDYNDFSANKISAIFVIFVQ